MINFHNFAETVEGKNYFHKKSSEYFKIDNMHPVGRKFVTEPKPFRVVILILLTVVDDIVKFCPIARFCKTIKLTIGCIRYI